MLSLGNSRPHHRLMLSKTRLKGATGAHLLPSNTELSQVEFIFVICGPAGCGKSTVASYASTRLGAALIEGDDYHSSENKTKMANNTPLTDADLWDWLITLRNAAIDRLQHSNVVIVSCSALKRKYRDVFRVASYEHPMVHIRFIHLALDEIMLRARLQRRQGHYMKEEMLRSQLNALEEPREDEYDVVRLNAGKDSSTVCEKAVLLMEGMLDEQAFLNQLRT